MFRKAIVTNKKKEVEKLSHIWWVSGRGGVPRGEIDEGLDYCGACAVKVRDEERAKHPADAEFIHAEGGDCIRESDYLAACSRCDCCLACSPHEGNGEVVETQEEWDALMVKIDGEG